MEDENLTHPRQRSEGLDIEYMALARTSWGTHIHPDGGAEEWTGRPDWEPLVHLSEVAMAELAAALRESSFFDVPARVEPERLIRDGTAVTWQLSLDGRRHTVPAQQMAGAVNPVLQLLNDEVQRHVGEALNRIADSESQGQDSASA